MATLGHSIISVNVTVSSLSLSLNMRFIGVSHSAACVNKVKLKKLLSSVKRFYCIVSDRNHCQDDMFRLRKSFSGRYKSLNPKLDNTIIRIRLL
jgi:hypothetical protein